MRELLRILFLLFLIQIGQYVQCEKYTQIVGYPVTVLQEQFVNPSSVGYVSSTVPPTRRRNRKINKKRPRPVVEQYLKEVTPTTKTSFSERHIVSTTEKNDRIITQEEPMYYRHRPATVDLPVVTIPREYLNYFHFTPVDEYKSVRSSNRNTQWYLPTDTRFREIDPDKDLLNHKQQLDDIKTEKKEKLMVQRARSEVDTVPHIVGYFSVSHEGIVPKNRETKTAK